MCAALVSHGCSHTHRVRSKEEAVKKMKRRKKRRMEKQQHKAAKTADGTAPGQQQQHDEEDDEADAAAAGGSDDAAVQASDEVGSLLVLISKHKLKSFCFNPAGGAKGCLGQIALGLSNNSIEVSGSCSSSVFSKSSYTHQKLQELQW